VALERRFVPPGREHWLGTDELGRDVLARVIHGSRVSVGAGLLAAFLAVVVGVGVGAVAGLFGGLPDRLALFGIDVVQAVPPLVLVAAGAAFFPPGALTAPLLIGLTGWTASARLVRADARRVRGDGFVESVRAAGGSRWRILLRHVLPHASGPAIAAAPYVLADAVMTEASLSFLGLGVPPPTASWGRAIADARGSLSEGWWCAAAPAAALLLLLLSARALGEALSSLESAEQQ
jgi:peptide/nickel transport system permease protein